MKFKNAQNKPFSTQPENVVEFVPSLVFKMHLKDGMILFV